MSIVPPKKLAAFVQNDSKPPQMQQKKGGGPPQMQQKKGGGGPPGQMMEEEDAKKLVAEEAEKVANGDTDPELMDHMLTFDPEDNPPEWAADPGVWNKAEKAVDPEGEGASYDEPYAVVAHVYKRMGGKVKGGDEGGGGGGGEEGD